MESTEFISHISGLLENIVVRRDFLSKLNNSDKRNVLKILLRPSELGGQVYSKIDDYFDVYTEKSFLIFDKNIRSNYSIKGFAHVDSQISKVAIDVTYAYRLYPSVNKKFDPIEIGFLDNISKCSFIEIYAPDGQRKRRTDIQPMQIEEESGLKWFLSKVEIPEDFKKFPYLNIELKVIEYGQDHWNHYVFKALQPTDGFSFSLRCDNNLFIQSYMVYDISKFYHIDVSNDCKEIDIKCHQWIEEGAGLSVIVSSTLSESIVCPQRQITAG